MARKGKKKEMDANQKVILILLATLLVVQGVGLYLGAKLIAIPEMAPTTDAIYGVGIFLYIMVATAVVLVIIKFKRKLLKVMELLSIFLSTNIFFVVLLMDFMPDNMASAIAWILAGGITLSRIFWKNLSIIMIFIITMRNIKNHGTFNALRKVMVHWGFAEIEATIYSLLVLKKEPMTAREIAEEIGYAYSSVVNALNNLRRHELVEREKGRKCYSYRAVIDFIRIIKNERRRVRNFLTEAREALEDEKDDYSTLWEHLNEGIEYLGKIDKEEGEWK